MNAGASSDDRVLIERFLEMLAAETGAAKNTLAAYASDLRLASDTLGGALTAATPGALARLGDGWADLSRATVARKSAALRRFFAFLVDEGHRADDPGAALPRPGARRALPKVLSHHDVDRLFAAIAGRLARDPLDPNDLRLAALVELLYGSGLRATELVSLPRHSWTATVMPKAASACAHFSYLIAGTPSAGIQNRPPLGSAAGQRRVVHRWPSPAAVGKSISRQSFVAARTNGRGRSGPRFLE